MINFNHKQIIKIGRGHDNDLRIADISVSRCHSFIKKDSKGNIVIEDNQSKFGTLVQLRAPLVLSENLAYYIQIGRTIVKLQVASEWSFLNGIMKAGFNKKYEHDEHYDKENIFNPATGDYFYDHIGKYCCNDFIN